MLQSQKPMTNPLNSAQQIAAYNLSKNIYGSVSKAIQLASKDEAAKLGLTKKAFGEAAFEMHYKRQHRLSRDLTKVRPVAAQMKRRIEDRLTARLFEGFTYRQPESRWVEQYNGIQVEIRRGKPSEFTVRQDTVWHPKHAWKAQETVHRLLLNPLDDFTTEGGLLTVFAKADRRMNAIPARWWEQSRGFSVREVSGFLVFGRFHIETTDKKTALAKGRKLRAAERAKIEALEETTWTAKTAHKMFGWCIPGIRQFCEINGLDPEGSYTTKQVRNIVIERRKENCKNYASYLRHMGIVLNCK